MAKNDWKGKKGGREVTSVVTNTDTLGYRTLPALVVTWYKTDNKVPFLPLAMYLFAPRVKMCIFIVAMARYSY
jgi:hypothetical protein